MYVRDRDREIYREEESAREKKRKEERRRERQGNKKGEQEWRPRVMSKGSDQER